MSIANQHHGPWDLVLGKSPSDGGVHRPFCRHVDENRWGKRDANACGLWRRRLWHCFRQSLRPFLGRGFSLARLIGTARQDGAKCKQESNRAVHT